MKEERKKQISKIMKEYYSHPENRKKVSEATKLYYSNSENRKKASDTAKAYYSNPENRKKAGDTHRGKKLTEEHKRKLSESHKGKPSKRKGTHSSEETKKKNRLKDIQRKKFENYRKIKLDNSKTQFVSLYMIFTPYTEYNEECERSISIPLTNAYEKIYLSELTRLKLNDMTKEKIVDVFTKANEYTRESVYTTLQNFRKVWEEQGKPDVMSIVSDGSPDDWKWHIELRMNKSVESTDFTKMKLLEKEK